MKAKLNKKAFYTLSFTWGIILTLIGIIVGLIILIKDSIKDKKLHLPKKWGHCFYIETGNYWGGLNLGVVFIVDKTNSVFAKNHEMGHAIQNCYFGPFMLLVTAASAIRYHYRNYLRKKDPAIKLPDYYSIWFEAQANKLGKELKDWLDQSN